MSQLPTVTFLFTDIEGSTQRWEQSRQAMAAALIRHDALLRGAIESHGGLVFKTVGDAFCAAFAEPAGALDAALATQRAVLEEDWAAFGLGADALRVRTGLHTGMADERDGDYFGPDVNRVARLMSCGHGGQILLSGATEAHLRHVLPEGVALRNFGERRLKDLRQPERIFQVLVADLPTDFPPLATLDVRPNNLPLQLTSLVGRVAEVADLASQLRAADGPRLVTLTGAGGTGKTRLSLQVAADLIDDFDHGVWFVDLAPLVDPELVAPTIAAALGIEDLPGQNTVLSLQAWLATRRLLLVLDNYERLLPAAPLVADLLAAAPQLKVLVSSREPLQIRGERTLPVQPLAVPAVGGREPVAVLLQYDAVNLFLQRASDANPDFAVTAANAPAVAEICSRLDGLPLAIELAAARVRAMAPQDILARLDSRLRLLTWGARDLPERHRTIRAAIDWSYDLLGSEEKLLFRRLSIFAGGATLEAAEAVCNEQGDLGLDLADGLARMVEKSLVRHSVAREGWGRYSMLETVREYATEELERSGEVQALRARHAGYFVDRSQRIWLSCEDVLTATASGRHIGSEGDNLRAVLDWCQEHDPDSGLVLIGTFAAGGPFLSLEIRHWVKSLLERAPSAAPSLRAGALVTLGSAYQDEDKAESAEHLREALRLYRGAGDAFGAALAQIFLAYQEWRSGRIEAFRASVESARVLAESSGNIRARIHFHWLSAEVDCDSGNPDGCLAHLEAWRQIHLDVGGNPPIEDWSAGRMKGAAFYFAARLQEARAVLDEVVAEFRGRGEVEPITWGYAGLTYLALDEVDVAAVFFREGLDLAASNDVRDLTIWHLEGLASVALRQSQSRQAAILFGAASTMREMFHCALEPADLPRREHEWVTLEAQLGTAAMESALAEGRALSRQAAITLALGDDQHG